MRALTDKEFEEIRSRLNTAIHEIVFACQFAEDDQLDSAGDCLVTAQATIETVAEQLCQMEGGSSDRAA